MASTSDNFYVTFVDVDRDLLKIWGQRSRVGATYIERQLLQLVPEFNRTQSPPSSHIHKGMFCFAKYTDDNYYRARVISGVQGESVGVLFVDYGNKDIINISNIRVQEGAEGDVLAKMAEQAEEYYLARIKAPSGGWTKKIVSEIRRDICYDEFICQTIAQVGDQKVLEIKFHNEDFSNYLVKKQIASPISLQTQQQMILSYCSLVSNDSKQSTNYKETSKENFPNLGNFKVPSRISYMGNEARQNLKFDKPSNSVSYSQGFPTPPPPSDTPPLHIYSKSDNSMAHGADKNNPGNSYYSSLNHPPLPENFSQSVNPSLNALLNSQYNPLYQMKGNFPPMLNSFNKVMVEALAKQIKQYITEDNAKSNAEKIPHHYVNSVLEVGKTYSIFVSCIDDGPWSFSVRLLSSESELEKLISDLESCELVNIKPPIILGHPCIGLSEYGNYCRGVIVSVSRSAVKVYFVDFGNTEDLPVSSIFELPPKFFKTRVLSQKFCLSGLNKVAYSEDIKKFFAEVVQDKVLMLRVISLEDDNLPTCELYLKDKNIKRILNEKMQELKTVTQEEFPKVGESENVVVTWVVSPLRFYIQLRKKDPELNELKKELSEIQSTGQPIHFQEVTVGLKCVCHYETDGQWYRAVVTAIESENEISVFYIDYGNTEKVGISRLRKINSSGLINQMRAQAIQCSLKGFENKSFDQDLINKLEALILEKDLKMTVVSSDKDQICVQLFENEIDISSFLTTTASLKADINPYISQNNENDWRSPVVSEKNGGVKFEKKNKSPEISVPPEKKENTISRGDRNREKINSLRRFQDTKNNKSQFRSTHIQLKKRWEDGNKWRDVSRNSEDLEKFKVMKDKKPLENQKFLGNRGLHQSRNEKREELNHDKKRNDGVKSGRSKFDNVNKGLGMEPEGRRIEKKNQNWDNSHKSDFDVRKRTSSEKNDKSPLIKNKAENKLLKSIKKEDIAPQGSKFKEKFLEIGSSEKGIVTFYFNPSEFYVQLLTQEEEFKQMMQDIQYYYHDKYSLRDPVQTGDIVIAQFSLDKILYRAEVVKPSPVTVLYVDYGNLEPVTPKCIWAVDKKFLKLPKQVIKCRLSNLQPLGSEWPPPGSDIDSFFEMEEYKCTFLNFQEGTYEISMENMVNHLDVAQEIISAGLGKPREPHIEIPEVDYTLLPNQTLRLFVSHVVSFTKFYVILNPESAEILEKEIKAYAENKGNLTPMGNFLKTGIGCLCSDNISWYRGVVVENKGNNVVVWFKDRGDTVEIPADKVKKLPQHLDVFQPQAIECCLQETKPSVTEQELKTIIEKKYFLVSVIKMENKRLSVVLYSERGEKLDFQTTVSAPETIEPISCLPLLNQKLQVTISHAESPKEIYIQRLADSETLNSLSQQLSDFYSEKKDLTVSEETLLVAAKSEILKKWCRGRVLSVLNDAFEIFYIDFGNKETLTIERVKRLDDTFINLNALCTKVGLNVDLDNTEELKESWDNLMTLVQGKELAGFFINNSDEILSEFLLDGKRLTPLLKVAVPLDGEDKFQKFFPDKEISFSKDDAKSQIVGKKEVNSRSFFELKAFVSHIDSPEQFWVHKESEINKLHQFQDKLQKCCEKLPDKKNIKLHDMVAALFSDMWYRAEVINVEKDIITVQFIDYGNTIDVDLNYEKVKELTPDIIDMASFATCYSLKGNWFADASSKFEEIILQYEDPVEVEILEEGNPSVVDLFQNGQSIREQLIKAGVGLEKNPKEESDFCTVYITHYTSPDDFYVQRESCTDSLLYISEGLVEAESFENATGVLENEIYAAKFPEDGIWYRAKVIRKHSDRYEVLFIDYGNTSNVTEVKLLPDYLAEISGLAENYSLIYGNNCDTWSEAACQKFSEFADGRPLKMKVIVNKIKKPVVKLYNENVNISKELEALSEDDGRSEVYVTHALSPIDFFIQYVDDDDYKLIFETLKNGTDCEILEDKTPGSLCQAVFSQDGLWYRGKILQNLGEGCEIFFLDFGNISTSTELKKLPPEIENIPPKALRCALNLKEKNIQESVKEEFINLTSGGDSIFRVRIITPGEVNIVSLKLDGIILEETLTLNTIPIENTFRLPSTPTERDFLSLEDGTDDDKKSKINISTNNYLSSNLNENVRVGGSIRNETDEEKRVKIAIADVASEGFKSDDEKGISEGTVLSSIVNATDNELIEEYQDNNNELIEEEIEVNAREENLDQNVSVIDNSERGITLGETIDSNDKTEKFDVSICETDNREMKIVRNKAEKISPGSVSPEESCQTLNENNADSLEEVNDSGETKKTPVDGEINKETNERTLSSPTTTGRNYSKIAEAERIVPGFISSGNSIQSSQNDEEGPLTESIVPETESDSVAKH